MKGFDVLKIKSGVRTRNKLDLSFTHLSTLNFGEIVPLLSIPTVPGDEFKIDAGYFSRLAPLVKPTYGKFQFKTVAGFVPYHMISSDAEAWLAGKNSWEGNTPHHRYFKFSTLHSFLISNCVTTTGATASNSVYTYRDSAGVLVHTVFTGAGKYYVKILNALGYALPSGVTMQTTSAWYTTESNRVFNAYPLLCFFKLYNDYLSQTQRFNTSQLSNILNAIKYGRAYTGIWTNTTGEILNGGLSGMFTQVLLNYENDYFNTAWQAPSNPINTLENNIQIYPSGTGAQIRMTTNSVDYVPSSGSGNITNISQRALDYLRSFDNWVKRNNYSGSKVVQQIYSRFGIKTSDYRDHYANVISVDSMPIQVGDVTATADTANATLGAYSGKGVMNGKKGISYKCDDYGQLFIFGFFTVTPMNAYGFDRDVLRFQPLDFYNPEFDGLGADPISVGEYYADPIDTTNAVLDSSTFGFTERYNAYRFGRDKITGDFRDYHANGDMNAWHTGRNLSAIRNSSTLVAQNTSVNTMPQYDSEYNRIFSVTNGSVDHFYLTAQFNVDAIRPMKNLNQVADLGEGDTVVPRNGNVIS